MRSPGFMCAVIFIIVPSIILTGKTRVKTITDSKSAHAEQVAYSDPSWTVETLMAEKDRLLKRQKKYMEELQYAEKLEKEAQSIHQTGEEFVHRRLESSIIIQKKRESLSHQQRLEVERRKRDSSAQLKSMDRAQAQQLASHANKQELQRKLNRANKKLAELEPELTNPVHPLSTVAAPNNSRFSNACIIL